MCACVQVIVLWTANTERFCDVEPGLNDTAEALLASIRADKDEVSPSSLFAVASIMEGVCALHVHVCVYTVQVKKKFPFRVRTTVVQRCCI